MRRNFVFAPATLTTGCRPIVLVTTPPQPASNARMMLLSDSVGGADESRKRILELEARERETGHVPCFLDADYSGHPYLAEGGYADILIKNGTIVTATDRYVGDVFVEGEKITTIGTALTMPADRVIDATGKYVMPGGIDVHTHMDMPFGGTTSADDFESGTHRRGVRRHDDDRRLRDPDEGRDAAPGARHVARRRPRARPPSTTGST